MRVYCKLDCCVVVGASNKEDVLLKLGEDYEGTRLLRHFLDGSSPTEVRGSQPEVHTSLMN
jgi:hypothetical protein